MRLRIGIEILKIVPLSCTTAAKDGSSTSSCGSVHSLLEIYRNQGLRKHAEGAKALHKSSDISRVRVAFEELSNCWKPQLCIETILKKNALNIQYNFLNLKACNFPHSLHSQHLPANCMKNYTWGTFKLSLGATPIEVNALIYLLPKKISVKQCATWASEV